MQMLYERDNIKPEFNEFPEVPPMIALALGKKAATYGPAIGMNCSEEQMKSFFGEDLGFTGECPEYGRVRISLMPDRMLESSEAFRSTSQRRHKPLLCFASNCTLQRDEIDSGGCDMMCGSIGLEHIHRAGNPTSHIDVLRMQQSSLHYDSRQDTLLKRY